MDDWRRFDQEKPLPHQFCVCSGSSDGKQVGYGLAVWTGSFFTWIVTEWLTEEMVFWWLPIVTPPMMERPDRKYVIVGTSDLADMRQRLESLERQMDALQRSRWDA